MYSGAGNTYFNSFECATVTRNIHVHTMLIGSCYLMVDAVTQWEMI